MPITNAFDNFGDKILEESKKTTKKVSHTVRVLLLILCTCYLIHEQDFWPNAVLVPPQQKIQAHAEFLYLFEERQARIQQQYSSPTPK